MNIKLQQDGRKGAFYIDEGNERLGELTFSTNEKVMILHHTEVSDKLRGKGAGNQLVAAAVDHARRNSFKIDPRCSFARKILTIKKEFGDILL